MWRICNPIYACMFMSEVEERYICPLIKIASMEICLVKLVALLKVDFPQFIWALLINEQQFQGLVEYCIVYQDSNIFDPLLSLITITFDLSKKMIIQMVFQSY